jgi:hypothetical protein
MWCVNDQSASVAGLASKEIDGDERNHTRDGADNVAPPQGEAWRGRLSAPGYDRKGRKTGC